MKYTSREKLKLSGFLGVSCTLDTCSKKTGFELFPSDVWWTNSGASSKSPHVRLTLLSSLLVLQQQQLLLPLLLLQLLLQTVVLHLPLMLQQLLLVLQGQKLLLLLQEEASEQQLQHIFKLYANSAQQEDTSRS